MTSLDEIIKNMEKPEEKMAEFKAIETEKKEEKTKALDYDKPIFDTEESKKKIRIKFAKGKDRKERKRIMKGESYGLIDRQKMVLGFFAVSVFGIFMMFSYAPNNNAIMTIVLLVGMSLFLPVGMILGWMMLDPYMRCKIMRKLTRGKNNFGLINFVGKGSKIVTKIKNFDEDLVWIKNRCWVLAKGKIKEINKDGEVISDEKVIDPGMLLTLSETVPVMFIDLTSMEPLSFSNESREKVSPEEIGSFMKGWVDNQMAKIMFLKKTLDIYFIIVICSCIAAAFLSYQNMTEIEALKEEIMALKDMIGGIT